MQRVGPNLYKNCETIVPAPLELFSGIKWAKKYMKQVKLNYEDFVVCVL